MADYREISQQYAQGGIKSVVWLNAGAAVAVLSQLSQLDFLAHPILWAMVFWSLGMTAGAFAWMMAFGATRYVDKHYDEKIVSHIDVANNFQTAGISAVFVSLAFFLAGAVYLAFGYSSYFGKA